MSSSSRNFRKNPFLALKKKKKKNMSFKKMSEMDKEERKNFNLGSWFSEHSSTKKQKIGIDDYEISEYEDSGDEDQHKNVSSFRWIMDFCDLKKNLKLSAVCRHSHSELYIDEKETSRAGLATKIKFRCVNECERSEADDFFPTTPKAGAFFEVNRTSVLASRAIGKGRQGLLKLCSILGLSPPVMGERFSEHTKYLEKISSEIRDESMLKAGERVRDLETENGTKNTEPIDTATCFDGTWSSRGWSARDGVVTAISEVTSQVLDVAYKSTYCRQCQTMEEKKATGKVSHFEYLTWYVNHEPACLLNHQGSAQVNHSFRSTFQISLSKIFGKI